MRTGTYVRDRPKGRADRTKKSLGQHFLVDRRVLRRIVSAAAIASTDLIVEIGPGRGILTEALLEAAHAVKAVELDDTLARDLRARLENRGGLEVVTADGRYVPLAPLVGESTPYKVVANLPYYAASPIVRRFLEAENKPTLMVVLVQKEVAQNMTASPGKMGLLSVATQLYGSPRIVASVPPGAFRPAPKVTSALVRIDVYPEPALKLDSIDHFFELVRAGFSSPRKQIHNSLGRALSMPTDAVTEMLSNAVIDATRRPGTLSLQEWGRLYGTWRPLEAAR